MENLNLRLEKLEKIVKKNEGKIVCLGLLYRKPRRIVAGETLYSGLLAHESLANFIRQLKSCLEEAAPATNLIRQSSLKKKTIFCYFFIYFFK